jgi:hypothetical protein
MHHTADPPYADEAIGNRRPYGKGFVNRMTFAAPRNGNGF